MDISLQLVCAYILNIIKYFYCSTNSELYKITLLMVNIIVQNVNKDSTMMRDPKLLCSTLHSLQFDVPDHHIFKR